MTNEKISASLEDYLEAIYTNIQTDQQVKAITLSRQLCFSRASVTEALKKLAAKNQINYDRYGDITLTDEGFKTAQEILAKHNLLMTFFKNVLKLDEQEAEANACRVEHVISQKAYENLKKFMSNELN